MNKNQKDPVKLQITQLAAEQPFWTGFKLTLGYYAASLLCLCLFLVIPFIIYAIFHL